MINQKKAQQIISVILDTRNFETPIVADKVFKVSILCNDNVIALIIQNGEKTFFSEEIEQSASYEPSLRRFEKCPYDPIHTKSHRAATKSMIDKVFLLIFVSYIDY
jgi:hypothetical protein